MKNTLKKISIWLLGICWLSVTFAALAGMYHLWWQRERVLYSGKSITQQRETVFQRAGFPSSLVKKTESLIRQWPADVRYEARGDSTSLSYIKYLLIPRIPADNTSYILMAKGEELTFTKADIDQRQILDTQFLDTNNPLGLILSFTLLLGWAGLILRLWREKLTWPESLALSCFFITLLVLPIRFFFHSAHVAFIGATIIGVIGWMNMIFNYFSIKGEKGWVERITGVLSIPFAGKKRKEQVFVALLLGITLAAISWSFIMSVVVVPDDWDAWAIWGSKAKVLAQGTGPLHDVTKFGHPDYPLLWPTIWGFSGWLSGGWEECWSKGWGTIFLFFCVWEIVHIVKEQCRSLTAGLLAGALFVSIPNVPLLASWSYAEAPLWLMMTCGLACFLRWQDRSSRGGVVIVALFAAATAYTKNEGILFAVLLGTLFFFGGRNRLRAVFIYASIFIFCYLLWWYWSRIYYDLGSHVTVGLHFDTGLLYRAAKRIPSACEAIFTMWRDIRQWNIVGFGIISVLVGTLFGFGYEGRRLYLLLPAGLILGYLVVILFHNAEIYWQIGTAWNRLTTQTLPLFLVLLVPMYQNFSAKHVE
ncbi:MAG: hypothetical protein D3915_12985 [Candidatus Electrothrix sp. AU1_5]|nr:hypothetical protein [Candidatus Electrothrix gigas]